MKEGLSRRDILKGALAAGAAASLGGTAEAASSPEKKDAQLDRIAAVKQILGQIAEKTKELSDAYHHHDEQKMKQIEQELNELYKRAKPMSDDLVK